MTGREVVYVGMRTPWGTANYARVLAPGVGLVSTPGHGGIKLSAARNRLVHAAWRERGGWYEEDCDFGIVLYTFADVLSDMDRGRVRESLERWNADGLAAVEADAGAR